MWKILVICALIAGGHCQQECDTPDGGKGICKDITDCPKLHPLGIRALNSSSSLSKLLSYSGCNQGAFVCCPECFNPDGKSGVCKPLQQCNSLQNLATKRIKQNDMRFITHSLCKERQNSFCCGPPPDRLGRADNCSKLMTEFPPDPNTECSGLEAAAAPRIVGGSAAGLDEYPWLVLLEYVVNGKTNLYCGGTLISGKYVLTAAHCMKLTPVSVRLGEYDLRTTEDCQDTDCAPPFVSIGIESIIVHEEYNITTSKNDIALLRLKDTAPYTEFIRPISLPIMDVTNTALRAVVAGWGKVSDRISQSRVKQFVEVPIVSTADCQAAYSRKMLKKAPSLWSKQLCAGGELGKDSCNGDSGGPLMMKTTYDGKQIMEIIGVVSIGPQKCGTKDLPGIYTKVFDYLVWIRSKITI